MIRLREPYARHTRPEGSLYIGEIRIAYAAAGVLDPKVLHGYPLGVIVSPDNWSQEHESKVVKVCRIAEMIHVVGRCGPGGVQDGKRPRLGVRNALDYERLLLRPFRSDDQLFKVRWEEFHHNPPPTISSGSTVTVLPETAMTDPSVAGPPAR